MNTTDASPSSQPSQQSESSLEASQSSPPSGSSASSQFSLSAGSPSSSTPSHLPPSREASQREARLTEALSASNSSTRLKAALAAGSRADPGRLETLVERCAVEPDFFVRDMLSWALTRLPPEAVLPRLRRELGSECRQARSQALHTLSKIGDKSAWGWITRDMLRDSDDELARTAWRCAVALVPEGEKKALGEELAGQLGRGDRDVQLSLSRALIGLGDAVEPALGKAAESSNPAKAAHARATESLRLDPELGFDAAIEEAKRTVALGAGGVWPDAAPAAEAEANRPQGAAENAEGESAEGAAAEAKRPQEGADC